MHLEKERFGILWRFNIQEKLQEKGLEFDEPYIILEVCNPFEAKRVLMDSYDQLLEIAQDVEKRLIACLDKSI